MNWYTIDLHIHTPASSDYQQENVSYLDILHRAEFRGIDILSFTDHNTISGFRKMAEEIQQLELLEKLHRIAPEEELKLKEYRRLRDKILILPGFEFTATFGFHILAIFPPDKNIREIEHLLLDLKIPNEQLDEGSPAVGATTDVLTAYRLINFAGGLVIAAHANSNNGVAMRGFPVGGQTKIAYTQDENLHALEVTDLEHTRGYNTATFFSGRKPEYPRRMHCIQGSDSHRLVADTDRKKNLGVGDRSTDVLLPEVSFESLLALFKSNDFTRTRPHRHSAEPAYDFIRLSQEEGASIILDFHESMTVRGGKLYAIISDICAFANTNGGTLYIGLSADQKKEINGIQNPQQSIMQLEKEVANRISPPLHCTLDVNHYKGKNIIRVLVPRGEDPPYAIDESKIYIRSEGETDLAVRDEIVGLVKRGPGGQISAEYRLPSSDQQIQLEPAAAPTMEIKHQDDKTIDAPRTGVEVVSVEERNGKFFYSVRDLRNGNVVNNVTLSSARKLWHYAISRYAQLPEKINNADINWQGNVGLIRRSRHGKITRYDLIQKTDEGYRYYFGVTDDGIHGVWNKLIGRDEE